MTRISPATCSTQCLNRHITPALCSAAFPLGIHKDCISESKAIRYITSCYYPQSIGVAPVVVAIVVPEDCMLLEIMTKPNSVMPWLSTSQDNLFSERSQGCFSFWTLLSCGWTLVKQRPPWPPPVQLEKSLSMMFCCSESECKMRYLQCELNNHCWTNCIELVNTALQSPYMITILLLSGAIRDIRILSCTTIGCPFFPDYILFEVETSKLCCKWHVSGPS